MYTPQLSNSPSFLFKDCSQRFGTSDETLKACILIDLPDLELMRDLKFLDNDGFKSKSIPKKQYFLDPLLEGEGVGYSTVDFLAFKKTGGSNLDPESRVTNQHGEDNLSFEEEDICPKYDSILAITDYSLTAPLTAMAKKHNFRGATLHGVNDIIPASTLGRTAVDYEEISKQAEVSPVRLTKLTLSSLSSKSTTAVSNCASIVTARLLRKVMVFALLASRMLLIYQQVKYILCPRVPMVPPVSLLRWNSRR